MGSAANEVAVCQDGIKRGRAWWKKGESIYGGGWLYLYYDTIITLYWRERVKIKVNFVIYLEEAGQVVLSLAKPI